MYFINKFFNKACLQFLGRGGISYYDGVREYYVGTQNFVPNNLSKDKYGVIIFTKYIRYKKADESISDDEKKRIAFEVKELLIKDKIIAEIE